MSGGKVQVEVWEKGRMKARKMRKKGKRNE